MLCVLSLLGWAATAARADKFYLQSGGKVEGKLLNPDESPRVGLSVEIEGGAVVKLDADQVTRVEAMSPEHG